MVTLQAVPNRGVAATLSSDETILLKTCAKCHRGVSFEDASAACEQNRRRAAIAIESLRVMGYVETPVVQLAATPGKILITHRGIAFAEAHGWAIWGNRCNF